MDMQKKMTFAKTINPDNKTITGYISTFGWDRDMERFVKGAWDFSHYVKNPVVLWSHDISQPPIAKNVDMKEDEFGVLATSEFDSKGEKAMEIFSLFERKFLSAFSVGFLRKDYNVEDTGLGSQGLAITKAELYEYSAVSVPANPGALVARELAQLAIKALGTKCIETLKTKSMGEQFLVVPDKGPGDPQDQDEGVSPELIEPTPPEDPDAATPVPNDPPAEEDSADAKTFEPVLKQVIEMAKAARGTQFSEQQRILLTTAISVFNDMINENKKNLGPAELMEMKRVLVEFAGVTAQIYPTAAIPIQKMISQIDKAVTGQAN